MKKQKKKKDGMWVVVLSDGETWTSLGGCKLMWLPEEAIDVCESHDADTFADVIEEELGPEVAQKIEEYDLDAVLRSGIRLD